MIDPQVVERLVRAGERRASPMRWLTPREREVLEAMARSMSNAAIASHFAIGVRSVRKHMSAIFVKLGVGEEPEIHRRVQAVLTFLSEVD